MTDSRTEESKRSGPDWPAVRIPALQDALGAILAGLADPLGRVLPRRVRIPEPVCRRIAARWNDPTYQERLRRSIQAAVATALKQKVSPGAAEMLSAHLTDTVLHPSVKATGDGLLERLCPEPCPPPRRSVDQPGQTDGRRERQASRPRE